MKRLIILVLAILALSLSWAQTYTGTGGPIDNSGSTSTFQFVLSNMVPAALNANHGLKTVCVNIQHTYDDDLIIRLHAPDGTTVALSNQHGGAGQNYTNTCFSDSAQIPISAGFPPFQGLYAPDDWLGTINNGQNGNGVWQLEIEDAFPFVDSGFLLTWTMTFGANASEPFSFDSSFLPIVVINTFGQSIVDEPKIMADMGIIDNGQGQVNHTNDSFNNYNGKIGIEIRGRSSQGFAKKSYGFETWDAAGNDIDSSLLGMPAESDWILHGPYSDKTLMRNALMMELARESGQYASRTKHVELMLNGSYEGVYVLMEKIKRDGGRVDIAKLDSNDVAGDDLTGGYIFQVNKDASTGWYSNFDVQTHFGEKLQFSHVYPKHDKILPVQANYIAAYVDSFERALKSPNWRNSAGKRYDEYIDLHSFAVFYLLCEIAKNVDSYRLSTFLYKDKFSKGGKLHAGPMWDLNLGFHNADYCSAQSTSGWMYDAHCDDENPFWYYRMRQDSAFSNELICTWMVLRATVLSQANMFAIVDSMANMLEQPATRNFERWDGLGMYLWPNPYPIPTTYAGEIQALKDWLAARGAWMDSQLVGTCQLPVANSPVSAADASISIAPNPSNGNVKLSIDGFAFGESEFEVQNMIGQIIRSGIIPEGNNVVFLELQELPSGIYQIVVRQGGILRVKKLVLE